MAHGQTLLLLLTPNTQLLIATGRRCRETARKRGENENENWFWLNSIYESENDDDIKRTTVTPVKNIKYLNYQNLTVASQAIISHRLVLALRL